METIPQPAPPDATEAEAPAPSRPEPHARLFGLRRSGLIEIGLFFAVTLAMDALFLGGTRFYHMEPHPFWLIVLLMSVQYGPNEGLVAALVASVALLFYNVPAQGLSQDTFDYLFHLTLRPLVWLIAAVLFGGVRQRQIHERENLRDELAELREQRAVISQAYRRLTTVKENLEARVAGQFRTVFTTYKAAQAIDKLGTAEVLMGVTDLVRAIVNPEKFSLFVAKDGQLEAVIAHGWSADDPFRRQFDASSGLYQSVVGGQQFLVVANPEDEIILSGQGVLAGPLVSEDTGEQVGMLKIESLGFLELGLTTVENFKILCEWIGTAYAKAKLYEQARSSSLFNRDLNLMSATFLERQTVFLRALAERVGFDVSTVSLHITEAEQLSREQHQRISHALSNAVSGMLRATDLAFEQKQRDHAFVVLLPTTPLAEAQLVADKLLAKLHATLGADLVVALSASVGTLHGHSKHKRD